VAEKCLRSWSIAAVDDGQGNPIETNLDENMVADCVQSTDQYAVSDIMTQQPNIIAVLASNHVRWFSCKIL
jgi:hypothetical protein